MLVCFWLAIAPVDASTADTAAEIRTVDVPPITSTNPFYIGNRQPLTPEPFLKLPIGSINPQGWLRHQLELEARGMTGRLPEVSAWCKFEGNAWSSPQGQGHSGWEELPYWLKGYGDLGYVLGNRTIMAEARAAWQCPADGACNKSTFVLGRRPLLSPRSARRTAVVRGGARARRRRGAGSGRA